MDKLCAKCLCAWYPQFRGIHAAWSCVSVQQWHYIAQHASRLCCTLQPGQRQHAMLPSMYQTKPTADEIELQSTGQKAMSAFTQYAGGSSELWRLLVVARTMHLPLAADPTLMTYAHTPPGITGVWTDFRQRHLRGETHNNLGLGQQFGEDLFAAPFHCSELCFRWSWVSINWIFSTM